MVCIFGRYEGLRPKLNKVLEWKKGKSFFLKFDFDAISKKNL
jgi:hypothetical protein